MFKHLLVPLDGSALAESVLPVAVSLASTFTAAVTLFHVIEHDAPEAVHADRHLTRLDEAEQYLESLAQRHFAASTVNWHVHAVEVKDVATSIAAHAEELQADLTLICTHGRGGVRAVLFGSIAQRVIARGGGPVLVLRPEASPRPGPFAVHKIMLPLDSESIHDEVFPYAKDLAQAYQAEIALLTVIPTFGSLAGEQAAASSLLPGTTAALLDITEQTAREHLQLHLDELREAGYASSAGVARGNPAEEIVSAAERWRADLMLLATHRKAGLDAFWAGSVAPDIARKTNVPLLLLPLK